jgi:hypothetical protein
LQILGITGDNASNNDTMIQYLSDALDEFPGPANQTRCFVHTINLIAKSILKPFDVRKAKDIREFNDVVHALGDSAEGDDPEDCTEQTAGNNGEEDDNEEEKGDDDDDEEEEEEDDDDDASLGPIRSMLLKVCLRFKDPNPTLLTNVEATENFVRTQELNDHPSAWLVQDALHSRSFLMHDAPGCIHSLELHF